MLFPAAFEIRKNAPALKNFESEYTCSLQFLRNSGLNSNSVMPVHRFTSYGIRSTRNWSLCGSMIALKKSQEN